MIALTFALPAESSDLIRRLAGKNILSHGDAKIVTGRLRGQEVEIVHTGVGTKIAGQRLHHYLAARSPAFLISAGFAGAARRSYRVGDLILARNFSDDELLAGARRILAGRNVHVARMFTSPGMVDSLSERKEIWRRHEAVAIDMETEEIARICADRSIRLLAIRVLSDTPRHPFPVPSDLLFDVERQRTPTARLCRHLLIHPGAIPRLLKFSRQIGQARRSLTDALEEVVRMEAPPAPGANE